MVVMFIFCVTLSVCSPVSADVPGAAPEHVAAGDPSASAEADGKEAAGSSDDEPLMKKRVKKHGASSSVVVSGAKASAATKVRSIFALSSQTFGCSDGGFCSLQR